MTAADEIEPYEWLAQEWDRLAIMRKMWSAHEVAAMIRNHKIPKHATPQDSAALREALVEARRLLTELETWHGNDAGDRAIRILQRLTAAIPAEPVADVPLTGRFDPNAEDGWDPTYSDPAVAWATKRQGEIISVSLNHDAAADYVRYNNEHGDPRELIPLYATPQDSAALREFARSIACTCEQCDKVGEDRDDISCRARRALALSPEGTL